MVVHTIRAIQMLHSWQLLLLVKAAEISHHLLLPLLPLGIVLKDDNIIHQ